ncbi:MAG: Rpn family recombination-promoting nuclease/putative transposase [Lachnospiraceae bacterium]|nr:Rpn family recombination-promoting nuclease/putative transposase [Lachnospiraceae bacterium]
MTHNVTTKLEKLNLTDRFLFDETMEDLEAYEATVNILLENEIELLTRPETEKEFRVSPELRAIRLDVINMDKDKTLYYTEMQNKNTGNLRKRSRYYQAHLDVSLLEPGCTNFNQLNDSFLIMIAPFDLFGKGLYRYTFEGTCRECPELKLKDGAIKVFINTKGKNSEDFSEEFLEFMEYLKKTNDEVAKRSKSQRIKRIHEQVKKIKASEKIGVKYMQLWEEMALAKEEAKLEGRMEGENCKLIKQICKKLQKGILPDDIAEILEEDLAIVKSICKIAQKYAPAYDSDKVLEAWLESNDEIT